ncbi:alpha/beta hydrolase [Oceanibacterium hippocampi]|uniref:Alpha/beta hydrolase family protein n=1 Tax=Oceanibacterium hippocampi TaxID=745714 RepID=A0A1Y5T9A1_9PROT|nr:alpha/beta hydrolase [Oceanibacterium hippocampi]SLN56764.1 Alpha/beta hydrolase family protein [Oceanibacterium hippocampi]
MRCLRPAVLLGLVLLGIGGCAPMVQEIGPRADQPAYAEATLRTGDGAVLPLQRWLPEGEPEAVLIGLHGFNMYSRIFELAGPWWAERGIATYAYDQRGFGDTPQAGIWPGTAALTDDLRDAVQAIGARHPDVPLYLVGESMGAAVILRALGDGPMPGVEGVVLVAPALRGWRVLNPFYQGSLWLAAHLLPGNRASGRGLGIQASDNITYLRDLGRDPLIIKETRIDAVYGLVGLMDTAIDATPAVNAPSLVLYGAKDELIPFEPVQEVAAALPGDSRFVVYPDGWHMLLIDRQAKTVWADIAAWIADPDGLLPSGAEMKMPATAESSPAAGQE